MKSLDKSLLVSPMPFPNIYWWQKVLQQNTIVDIGAHFEKMSFRNRYEIAGANGKLLMSIPLENGRNQRIPIREIKISYAENWQENHWRTLMSAYKRTPFFEFYEHKIQVLFTEKIDSLSEWNLKSWEIILAILKLDFHFTTCETYLDNSQNEFSDWRNYSQKTPIENYTFQKYMQPFDDKNGFIENLSILDLIFCEGPNSKLLL